MYPKLHLSMLCAPKYHSYKAIKLIIIQILGDWTLCSATLTLHLGLGRKHCKSIAIILKGIACAVGNEQISHSRQTTGISWSWRELDGFWEAEMSQHLLGNPRLPIQKSLLVTEACKTGWGKTVNSMADLLPTGKRSKFQFGTLNFFKELLKLLCFIVAKRCSF